MSLSGWTSHETVEQIHFVLEGGAILFFIALVVIALVVFDVTSHLATDHKRERRLERLGLFALRCIIGRTVRVSIQSKERQDSQIPVGQRANRT
jgi:hypothetical protein